APAGRCGAGARAALPVRDPRGDVLPRLAPGAAQPYRAHAAAGARVRQPVPGADQGRRVADPQGLPDRGGTANRSVTGHRRQVPGASAGRQLQIQSRRLNRTYRPLDRTTSSTVEVTTPE